MIGRLAFLAVVVIALGFVHRKRRRKAEEVSSGSRPIEVVGTSTAALFAADTEGDKPEVEQ